MNLNHCVVIKTDALKLIVDEKGFKRWLIAESVGVHRTTMRRWMSGRIKKIKPQFATKLAAELGVDISQITGE